MVLVVDAQINIPAALLIKANGTFLMIRGVWGRERLVPTQSKHDVKALWSQGHHWQEMQSLALLCKCSEGEASTWLAP